MNLTTEQIRWVVIDLFVLIVSVALHEFGHAYMATRMGDDTPRRQGRVTLNPLAHIDPIGTLLLPIAGGIYGAAGGHGGGFGWGKPVQWTPSRVKRGISMSKASILVGIAGPTMNLLLGTVTCFVHVLLVVKGGMDPVGDASKILNFAVMTNFVLFFFNLLPIPPLDGGGVLEELLPYRYRQQFQSYAKYSPFVLLAVAMIPQISKIFLIPAEFCAGKVYQLFLAAFGLG